MEPRTSVSQAQAAGSQLGLSNAASRLAAQSQVFERAAGFSTPHAAIFEQLHETRAKADLLLLLACWSQGHSYGSNVALLDGTKTTVLRAQMSVQVNFSADCNLLSRTRGHTCCWFSLLASAKFFKLSCASASRCEAAKQKWSYERCEIHQAFLCLFSLSCSMLHCNNHICHRVLLQAFLF